MLTSRVESMPSKMLVTTGFLVLLFGLGTADAIFVEKSVPNLPGTDPEVIVGDTSGDGGEGVRKTEGPDVLEVLVTYEYTFSETEEQAILERVVLADTGDTVEKFVILKEGDRAAFLAWVDSPDVKTYFLSLKEALHRSFTTAVKDLMDEAQRREGKPTRNLLTFQDTGLLPERVVVVRVRERLYEFHILEGKDDLIFELIEELTK